MILHQIFTSPFQHYDLQHCIDRLQANDAILLLQEGVYALNHPAMSEQFTALEGRLFALNSDVTARGLTAIPAAVSVIDEEQWLELCVKYSKIISW